VIDGTTDSVIITISVGRGPHVLVFNPTNNKIYSANINSQDVSVIDGTTDSVIATIPTGNYPRAAVYNSINNKVYIANCYSDNITVIDGTTNTIITTIMVGDGPCALVYDSTYNEVYCANGYSHNISVINGVTNEVIATFGVGINPNAFTYNALQNRIYVSNSGSSSISVIRHQVVGIEARQKLDVFFFTPEIYPNPAKSFFTIRLPLTADRQMIKIFDVSGKLIKEIATPSEFASTSFGTRSALRNDGEAVISLKGINPGIYFLRLGKETKKFLVVK